MSAKLSLACSSGIAIDFNYTVAYWAAGASIVVGLALFVRDVPRRQFSWLLMYGILLLIHPAWPMAHSEFIERAQAVSSDCGYAQSFFSVGIAITLVGVLLCGIFRPALRLRVFLGVLAAAYWQIYFAASLLVGIGFFPSRLLPAVLIESLSAEALFLHVAAVDSWMATASSTALLRTTLIVALAAAALFAVHLHQRTLYRWILVAAAVVAGLRVFGEVRMYRLYASESLGLWDLLSLYAPVLVGLLVCAECLLLFGYRKAVNEA